VWGFDTSSASPDQDLEFEHGSSWELGVRAITGEGWSGSLALWQTDFDDVAFFGPTNVYENIGDIRSEGVDLVVEYDLAALSGALEGLSFTGSLTLQDSEIVDAANPANDGNETPYAWEEKAAWSLQYTTEERWRFALGGVYVGESFSDDANTKAGNANGNLGLNPSRTVWDAQISREVELGEKAHLRFAIGATNVLDEEWFVHSRGGFFGPGLVAGPPRQLYFGLSLGF
jgi:outer membrane receptor protein involved in Fe transport